ncbi:farnesyl pyrophosphate synthase 2 [Pieris rapae]|uniref:farnesyl pyrophosphate synthase 2 n=1 Tax=Pieris rapae TaxID=64459 RepID=UPI000B926AD2|nr:farnesyl pyrophosphate synthase 2 [Pieris rapae]
MNSCTRMWKICNGLTKILPKPIKKYPLAKLCSSMSTNASIPEYKREMETFQDVYPSIIETISKSPGLYDNPDVDAWIKKLLDYNLHGGKKARGLATIYAYEILEKPENITEESLRLVRVLGWCVEMLQAYFLIMDDIMDASLTRRGVPCWYRLPEVGLGAINDCNLVQAAMYNVLKEYCEKLPTYNNIVHLFNETLFYTAIGQHLDFTMAHRVKSDYSLFTPERYSAIVTYKTAYYTFKMPVFLGMLVTDNVPRHTHQTAEKICLDLGYLFQMQDDYIDCFGAEHLTGKAGTDIQEGKCSWLAVQALQRLSEPQRKVFIACYGSHEPAHVERIKRLYQELGIPELYRREEKQRYDAIVQLSQTFLPDSGNMRDLFMKLLALTYNRKK